MWIRCWAIAGLLLSLLAADAVGVFTSVDNWLQARRYALAKAPVDSNLVVLAVDSNSIARIGQWPWPRQIHAQIVDKLVAARANQIAFDIDFSSASPMPGDDAFRKSLEAAGGSTILAGFRQFDGEKLTDTVPLAAFSEHAWIASVSVKVDSDGVIRRVPFGEKLAGQQTPSLAAYLAQVNGKELADINVDFSISSSSFQIVPAIDLIEGRVPASLIAGKDVIVGATAVELRDLFVTPTGEIVPGSVLQALAAETAKHGRFIVTPGLPVRSLGILIFGLLGLLVMRRSWTTQLALLGTAAVAVELTAFLLQSIQQISLPTTGWMTALVGLSVISTFSELDFRRLSIGSIQTRLGATRSLLQHVIADSPAGVIVVDGNDRVRVANLAARQVLNAGKTDWVGMLVRDALPPGLAQLFDNTLQVPLETMLKSRQGQLNLQLSQSAKVLEYSLTRSTVVNDGDGRAASARCLTFQDVTDRHEHEQRLSYLALHDSKTDCRNRNSFIQDLEKLAANGQRLTLFQMGIDRFKHINEDYGHEAGDQLLRHVAVRARALLADGKQLYRIAGDEFACMLAPGPDPAAVHGLAQSLLALAGTARLGPYEVPFSLSLGIASAEEGWSADEIIRRSGLALAAAKAGGGKQICAFDIQLDEAATRRKQVESALMGALERKEFHLLYQPQFDLASGRCLGVECLLRWTNPELGPVSPGEFIPIAEQIGAIEEIGAWVLQQACREISGLSEHVFVAVNVSPRQLSRGNLAATVARALDSSGLPPERLEIEITESVLAENRSSIVETLQQLRNSKVTVSLDDFGTGYSSLSYLLNLPLDKLKIDKSFITGLPDDPKANAVLASILGVAKALSLTTIAEGIETTEQRDALKQAGCQQGQGYLLARPMGPESLAVFLQILGLGVEDLRDRPGYQTVPAELAGSPSAQRRISA